MPLHVIVQCDQCEWNTDGDFPLPGERDFYRDQAIFPLGRKLAKHHGDTRRGEHSGHRNFRVIFPGGQEAELMCHGVNHPMYYFEGHRNSPHGLLNEMNSRSRGNPERA